MNVKTTPTRHDVFTLSRRIFAGITIAGIIGCEAPQPPDRIVEKFNAPAVQKTAKNDSADKVNKDKEAVKHPTADPLPAGSPVKVERLKEGKGAVAEKGKQLAVHYTGWLAADGVEFDSSVSKGEPLHFKLGVGKVIAGWDQGIAGMKVGEKRRLTIPPDLAYGPQGQGAIPGNATLVFDVELVEIHE